MGGMCVCSSSPSLPLSIGRILQAWVLEDSASGSRSHTNININQKPCVCKTKPRITVQDAVVMTVYGWWRTTACELVVRRTSHKKASFPWGAAVLFDWQLHHHSGWKTKRFSATNPHRHSVLAGHLVLFFFDLSFMHLFFLIITIKHFPLTLCRALLKKGLV